MFRIRLVSILLLGFAFLPNRAKAQDSATACPRDVSFWIDQCRDTGALICPEGMVVLARCVLEDANVRQWQNPDGSFETSEELSALSDGDLLSALRSQLQDGVETRDLAEAEYLALLLNVCAGALPRDAQISTSMPEKIGDLVSSFQRAIDRNRDLDTWRQIVEQVNRGNIDAPECPDPDGIFRNASPCGD